jgi:hypothetical protein
MTAADITLLCQSLLRAARNPQSAVIAGSSFAKSGI